jgi:hypothetical protein
MAVNARRLVKLSFVISAVAAAVCQLIPVNRTNPPANPAQAFAARMNPPGAVAGAIERSCRDCHSNATTWPWYSRIAPVSWLVTGDVNKGRSHLNFSEWGRLDARRSARILEAICEEVKSGDMPLGIYTVLHPSAKLSPEEVQAICGWTATVLTTGAGERR